ncbi:hypothetical protein [Limnohabitans sp.]|jgi:arginase family enzyme|uniref:hypothetical protein n=1 Tax=Limnohabitans sp. TaxID=1907725 RepID=UPI002FDD68D2
MDQRLIQDESEKKATQWVAFAFSLKTDYLLAASEAGAAASEATAEAASTGAEAATGAASTAGASFLPQATRAAAANKDANRIDLFMRIFLKGD